LEFQKDDKEKTQLKETIPTTTEPSQKPQTEIKTEPPSLKTYFPAFEKNKILKFSELFAVRKPTVVKPVKKDLRGNFIIHYYSLLFIIIHYYYYYYYFFKLNY